MLGEGFRIEQQPRPTVLHQFEHRCGRQAVVQRDQHRAQLAAREVQVEPLDAVLGQTRDAVTGAKTQWYSGPRCHVGEAAFAPDPDGHAEDDGWLLTLVWNDSTDESDLCIIDARDVAAGPVARVHAPGRVSFGFHVNWFADD